MNPIKTIKFIWSENADIEDGASFDNLLAAEAYLFGARMSAPEGGETYHKTKVEIAFESLTVVFTIDLQGWAALPKQDLADELIEYCDDVLSPSLDCALKGAGIFDAEKRRIQCIQVEYMKAAMKVAVDRMNAEMWAD